MTKSFDLSNTFVRLRDAGGAEPVKITPAFWGASARAGSYGRVVGAFDFASAADLHSSMQEMHPHSEEVLILAAGAIDVLLEIDGSEQRIALEAGQAAIVPRGVWHRLVVRRPGRLLFINDRTDIQGRAHSVR